MHRTLMAVPLAVTIAAAAAAQNVNPDVSIVGDVRASITDRVPDRRDGRLDLDLSSVELALQGYLNPFARADVFVGFHDGEVELEEAYATLLRGLPGGLQLRAGKFRVDFGTLNLLHPHALPFLDPPLVHLEYLGEEGLVDVGLNLNWQAPLGAAALTASATLLKGDFATEHGHDDEADAHAQRLLARVLDEHDDEPETDLGGSGRLALFLPRGDTGGVEVGVNVLRGTLDRAAGRHIRMVGAEVKWRWTPDRYRSLTVQGEWIRSERDVLVAIDEQERVRGDGTFLFVDWRFRQRWNVGAIAERTDRAEEDGASLRRAGVFAGFRVMEESTVVRLLLRRTSGDGFAGAAREAVLQLAFALGPHRPHAF